MNGKDVRRGAFRQNLPGFTLVELLVVVAIIALLVSILLPTLGKAKEQTRNAVCMTNLKSISLAFDYYVMENDEWYPAGAGYGGTIGMRSWDIVLNETPYLGSLDVLHCPSDNAARPWSRSWGKYPECDEITEEYGRYIRSYAINVEISGMGPSEYNPDYWPGAVHQTTDVEILADTILMADMWESFYHEGDAGYVQKWMPNQYSAYWGCCMDYNDHRPRQATFYHRGKTQANFLFCDGHVVPLRREHRHLYDNGDSYYWLREKN